MNPRRILFVDDEPAILEGLANQLRRFRKVWSMEFVNGGEAALARLSAEPFDVVVTDMRMPGIDGAALLKRVQETHPSVVRIVLSGQCETEAALRSVPVAHQFLAKPCEPDLLRGVVERALDLNNLLGSAEVRALVGGIDGLPALPEVYRELTAALADERRSLADVAQIVERDVGLSAKMLQVVNSAFFGLPRRITSVRQAVSSLGADLIRGVVLATCALEGFGKDPSKGVSLRALQRRSLATALMARHIAAPKLREDAFVAGMLHDIGLLIMAVRAPDQQQGVWERARAEGLPSSVVEAEVFGVTHAEIGAYLLGLWGMQYPVVEAVALHHGRTRPQHDQPDLTDVVAIAQWLIHEAEGGADVDARCPALEPGYLESLASAEGIADWRARAATLAGAATTKDVH